MDLAWWQIVLGVIVGIILLGILVILHELGHAIMARRNGVEVEEFGIGFPPRAKKLGTFRGIEITLNWLPLGGFCKLKGESDAARGKGTYGAASFWVKTKILLAGVFINLITAMVIFAVLAAIGMPKVLDNQFAVASDNHGQPGVVEVASVVEHSPAAQAGIKEGDEIKSLATTFEWSDSSCGRKTPGGVALTVMTTCANEPTAVETTAQVSDFTKAQAGQTVQVVIRRDGADKTLDIKLNDAKAAVNSGYLGVSMFQSKQATIKATWSAPVVGVVDTVQMVGATFSGLGGMVGNFFGGAWEWLTGNGEQGGAQIKAAGDSVAGPVGIFGTIFPQALAGGALTLAWLTGLISLTLAVMNFLPIPGLDGGRWFLTLIFKLARKPLTQDIEETINGWGMLFLFALIALITINDVVKFF
jgi:regulator of sigma E protease